MKEDTSLSERQRIAAISQQCMGKKVRQTSRIISGFYDDYLRTTGLHANQVTLLVAPYLAGPITINKMAEYVGLDRTTLIRNLKLLEEHGMVTIKPGKDLRTRVVTLTDTGHNTLMTALPFWEEAQREVLALLGAQHNALVEALETVNKLESRS